MARLRKDTQIIRATVAQEARYILMPEVVDGREAPANWIRRVQVLVAGAEQLFLGLDVEVQSAFDFERRIEAAAASIPDGTDPSAAVLIAQEALQREIGPNRTYHVPPFPPGVGTYPFMLRPHQWITAMVQSGYGLVTLVVEYLEDE